MVLAVVLWALVLVPLLWGIYQTLTGVVALFARGSYHLERNALLTGVHVESAVS